MERRVHRPFVVAESKDGSHKFVWLGLDEADAEKGILTNQYLVVDGDEALLIDPGGRFVFQRVYRSVAEFVSPDRVVGVFYSHQDPDVAGSISLVPEFFPNAKIYISALWSRFLPHLGVETGLDIVEIPDGGTEIPLGRHSLAAVPAHFLHSPGNFTLYDPAVKVLFSADIGAAVFPPGEWYLYVEDFEKHASYMEGFHRRYLCCKQAIDAWLSRVKNLKIEIIAPQHGSLFAGENVRRFLSWLESLKGVGLYCR